MKSHSLACAVAALCLTPMACSSSIDGDGETLDTVRSALVNCVTLYEHDNYGGYAVSLPEGSYWTADLVARGILDNDIGSLKVVSPYVAFLFEDDGLGAQMLTLSGNESSLESRGFNDKLSSLVIVHPNWAKWHEIDGYALRLIDPSSVGTPTLNRLVEAWTQGLPAMAARYNSGIEAPHTVWGFVDPKFNEPPVVARAGRERVHMSAAHLVKNPYDAGMFTHELAHLVQHYANQVPGWVGDGFADYLRYKYGVYNAEADWNLDSRPSSSNSYLDGYKVTARFFVWLENRKLASFSDKLNTAWRNGTYGSSFWTKNFNKSVDQLWSEYVKKPAL